MKRLIIIAAVVAAAAYASEVQVGWKTVSTSIVTFTGSFGGKYSVQCPNIDGGSGAKIFIRPGCPTRTDGGVSCVIDAGTGDMLLDFSTASGSADPFKVDLASNEDRIHAKTADGNANLCYFYRRSP